MALVARGDGSATVDMDHAADKNSESQPCGNPSTSTSDKCSGDVFVVDIGVVRIDDKMTSHPTPACPNHAPVCNSSSHTVFANNKGVARIGDTYATLVHNITAVAQSTVYAGD